MCKQVTVDEFLEQVNKEVEHECINCKYWELLPISEYRAGWGVRGHCSEMFRINGREYANTPHWDACPLFEAWESEPAWFEQLRKAKCDGGNIVFIKRKLLGWEIDLWNKRVYDKDGKRLEKYEIF